MSVALPSNNPNLPVVASLTHFDRASLAQAGGKGANLGELIRAGFEVPPGFIVTTAAYDLLLQANGLEAKIQQRLDTLQLDNPAVVTGVSQHIQDTIQHALIPDLIIDSILKAYRQLDGSAMAVRSSATAEDLPEAAFAGQQETFLNVIGEQALLVAVRSCWASLWSERAILYRARENVDQVSVKLTVSCKRWYQPIAG
jgi:rifampicin phosphotransferase